MRRRPIRATKTTTAELVVPTAEAGETLTGGTRFYLRYMMKDKLGFVGLVMIAGFLGWSLIEGLMQEFTIWFGVKAYGTLLLPYGSCAGAGSLGCPTSLNFNAKLLPPSLNHFPIYLFGTNFQGQSIFNRILYAAPHDATASIVIVGSAIVIGMVLGTAAGYFGGWVDEVLMRATDAFLSIPGLVLAITVAALIGGGFVAVLYALIIVWWPTYARFFRAEALAIRNKAYVEAAKLNGAGPLRILFKHIFPNSIDPIIAYATLDLGTIILTYSALAFLGIGVELGYPEWGAESNAGLTFFPQQWWWSVIPGVVIALVVVAFTLVGDRLQDLIGGRMTY